jgi:hypothetical protein
VDACRIAGPAPKQGTTMRADRRAEPGGERDTAGTVTRPKAHPQGRWPANLILSHTEDCRHDGVKRVKACGVGAISRSTGKENGGQTGAAYGAESQTAGTEMVNYADKDGKETVANWICVEDCPVAELDRQWANASRFFYTPKAPKREREAGCEDLPGAQQDTTRKAGSKGGDNPRNRGAKQRKNHHPTVKPIAIMEYLLKLVVPPGGVVVDPFLGSGTTLVAAARLGVRAVGIEREPAYIDIAKARIAHALKGE